jgi:hypothetical protein
MAGHGSLPCADYANLSALPAIHGLLLVVSKAGHDD